MNTRSYSDSEIKQQIDDCENRESKLSDWERSFIASIGDQVDKNAMLSEKQCEILDAVWSRIT